MNTVHSDCIRLADRCDPPSVAARLASSELFHTYVAYERSAGQMWFAADPLGRITVTRRGTRIAWPDRLDEVGTGARVIAQAGSLIEASGLAAWTAYGFVTFEAGRTAEDDHRARDDDVLADVIVPATEVRVIGDLAHVRSTRPDRVRDVCQELVSSSRMTGRAAHVDLNSLGDNPLGDAAQQAHFEARVGTALDEFGHGHLAKVVLSRTVDLPFAVDLPRTYVCGRRHNTPARSFLLDLGRYRAMGLCPETVLEVDPMGWVTAQPLAGTRRRGLGAERDTALRHELTNDPKEIYEHMISVRAARQDLGQVCERDTIVVSDFLAVKDRGSVQHLASTLRGRLRPDQTRWDAFQALSPAVTVSGVPKQAAAACIERLEQSPRGLYGGAVFVADSDGMLDAALVLRALIDDGTGPRIQAGAGIVAGSLPAREYDETCAKLRSVACHLMAASDRASPEGADRITARQPTSGSAR